MAKSDINAVVARALAYYMGKAGWSESELGRKAGVSARTVGNFLRPEKRLAGSKGKEPSGKLTELALIATALQIDMADLVTDLTEAERETRKRLHMAAHILSTGEMPHEPTVDRPRKPALI